MENSIEVSQKNKNRTTVSPSNTTSGNISKSILGAPVVTDFQREVILTQGEQIPVGLPHHVPVQGPLSRVQAFPFLLREFDGHILERKQSLKGKHISPSGQGDISEFDTNLQKQTRVRIDLAGVNVLTDPRKIILSKLHFSLCNRGEMHITKLATFKVPFSGT